MNKYISRILLLLVSVSFLGNSARAEESVFSGKNALLCMGVMAVGGLIKLGCNYAYKQYIYSGIQNKLDNCFLHNDEGVSFQKYRIDNYHSDKQHWDTASQILENRKKFKDVLKTDILDGFFLTQSEREKIPMERVEREAISYKKDKTPSKNGSDSGSECKAERERQRKLTEGMESIKVKVYKEVTLLYNAIRELSRHTDVYVHIANLINDKSSSYIWYNEVKDMKLRSNNDPADYYVIFSKFSDEQLVAFKKTLKAKVKQANSRWWKKFTNPYYKELSMQYWKLLMKYVRVKAIFNAMY